MQHHGTRSGVTRFIGLLAVGTPLALGAVFLAITSAPDRADHTSPTLSAPLPAAPIAVYDQDLRYAGTWNPKPVHAIEQLGEGVAFTSGTVEATIIDTRTFTEQIQNQIQRKPQFEGAGRFLPPHTKPDIGLYQGALARNEVPAGRMNARSAPTIGRVWNAIAQTPWTPPDPTLAVGPDHIVVTVNQDIAFYTKDGVLQFFVPLNDTGNPGFFETVGARGFAFDPKCFYDHYTGRFVVLALEVYGTGTSTEADDEATITFAISDDSDPNGVWYKYRTNAIINFGSATVWWDYPGFGYDDQAYYVTGNLFGLNTSGFGGTGFRIFDKAPLLTGAPAVFNTLTSGNLVSTQVAHHFGSTTSPFFLSAVALDAWRIATITDPLTSPSIQFADVATPFASQPPSAPTPGGNIDAIDLRVFNVQWRDGKLYGAHNINLDGRTAARWLQFDTNNWPTSGAPTLNQIGIIDLGPNIRTLDPAIFSDAQDNVAVVFATTSPTDNVKMDIAVRTPSDPPGELGAPITIAQGSVGSSGRWGDYYDITTDPNDDTTFWAIGQISQPFGWQTVIQEFSVVPAPTGCPGDIDNNNTVDLADFNILAVNFGVGPGATLSQGDLNDDGFVDLADFNILAVNFGSTCN